MKDVRSLAGVGQAWRTGEAGNSALSPNTAEYRPEYRRANLELTLAAKSAAFNGCPSARVLLASSQLLWLSR